MAIIATTGAVLLTDDKPGEVTTTVPGSGVPITPGGSSGSCVETYDLEALANREVAFAGTVTSVGGDQVTFEVERWFRGGDGSETTLTTSTGGSITPDAGPSFEPGARLLVAGDGGFAWGCGFSQPYNDAVAAEWADALEG